MYDYLIVGAGLYGAVFAHEAAKAGKRCLVIERRDHIGGNCYTEEVEGIQVPKYGAPIFRTADKRVWDYIQQFAEFNNFVNSPIANYHGEIYNMPFNMNTFSKMWGISTPKEAKAIIDEHELLTEENYQGVAVVNYTDRDTPYTRIIEHKHFEYGSQPVTVISREYPLEWREGLEPYYPINDLRNQERYEKYKQLADNDPDVIFGGRLGAYKYTDMQETIIDALNLAEKELK